MLGLLCKARRNTLFDLCSAWLNCIGPRWCWVVIKAVGCRPMRFLFRNNRSVWCWFKLLCNSSRKNLLDLYSATNMSVCADANITGTFRHFWTHKVHYKLQQSTLQNFDDGGFLSGWSFVRTPIPVESFHCIYNVVYRGVDWLSYWKQLFLTARQHSLLYRALS